MNKKRLLKLAEHLESGKLYVKKFDFGECFAGRECGCALVECVKVFPRSVKMADGHAKLKSNGLGGTDIAMHLFDLTGVQAASLFVPGCGNDLTRRATPKQVAKHIREFVG